MLRLRVHQSVFATAAGLFSIAALSGGPLAYEPGVHEATKGGVTIGVPTGALPPPGVYVNFNAFLYQVDVVDERGHKTGIKDNTFSPSAQLLWVPGTKLLGASYGAFIVQPYVSNAADIPGAAIDIRNETGFHNTFISPINLSWNLGGGLFTSAGFGFYAPTGTVCNANAVLPSTAGTGCPGLDSWTFQPRWAFSYLGDGWNITANIAYEWNTENQNTGYTSGNLLYGDFTVTKKFGNWELGPVAYFVHQTSRDRDPLGVYALFPTPIGDRKSEQFAIGGLVGYDFGPVKLNVIATEDVYARNTGDGFSVMTNLTFRLWGPDAPPKHTPLK